MRSPRAAFEPDFSMGVKPFVPIFCPRSAAVASGQPSGQSSPPLGKPRCCKVWCQTLQNLVASYKRQACADRISPRPLAIKAAALWSAPAWPARQGAREDRAATICRCIFFLTAIMQLIHAGQSRSDLGPMTRADLRRKLGRNWSGPPPRWSGTDGNDRQGLRRRDMPGSDRARSWR